MIKFSVSEVRIGRVRPLGTRGVPSGIDKQPVQGPASACNKGIKGDEQGDRLRHGGLDKAVHAYAASNYILWRTDLPNIAPLFRPGAFGENLVIEGVTESHICLGDQWRLGSALLEVSQGRQPCWKLNLRFGRPDMARQVQASGRSGWYFRVIKSGEFVAGDVASLVSRPHQKWTIARVVHLLYHDPLNMSDLAEFASLSGIPESWRRTAEARLMRR